MSEFSRMDVYMRKFKFAANIFAFVIVYHLPDKAQIRYELVYVGYPPRVPLGGRNDMLCLLKYQLNNVDKPDIGLNNRSFRIWSYALT